MSPIHPSAVIAAKYRLVHMLGEGGMGQVWLAENIVLQKQVALKLVRGAIDEEMTQRFLQEAIAASRVSHPAIVEIHDAGIDRGLPWIAMELLAGESLADRITRRPLSVAEVGELLLPIIDALGALHAAGIVHRDLKPDNIFLESTASGVIQPKLLDFGIAKQLAVSGLTKTGALVGTGHYLSPEQAKGARDLDARSDLYAMGVVMFESLSGRTPHAAESLTELIAKLFSEPPRSLRVLQPSVPEPIARVVHACLAREPAARPRDAKTLAALWRAASQTPRAPALARTAPMKAPLARTLPMEPRRMTAPSPAAPPESPPARSPALVLVGIVGGLAICGLAYASLSLAWQPAPRARPVAHAAVTQPTLAPTPTVVPSPPEPTLPPEPTAPPPASSTCLESQSAVRSGETVAVGGLSGEDVRRAERRDLDGLRACHQAALTLCAAVAGRVEIDLVIDEDGRVVESALASSTLDDGEHVESCLIGRTRHWRFPARAADTRARLALVLDTTYGGEPAPSRGTVRPPAGTSSSCEEGGLTVAVSPYDAAVFVDGQLRMDAVHGGMTTLCVGRHVVRVVPPRRARGYEAVERSVDVVAHTGIEIVVALPHV